VSSLHLEHDWWPRPLPDNVELGEGAWLWSSYMFLHYDSRRPCGVRVGAHSGVYAGTTFDLGVHGEVDIGRYSTVVAPIFATNGPVVIGDHAFVANQVHIADGPAPLPPAERDPDAPAAPAIVMGDTVWLGAHSTILAGARLGDGVIVAAGAVVDAEVPDYAIVAGNPSRIVGWARPGSGTRRQRGAT
jgi:acetyltransferase-like isoleucine patch superfamily enzyme